MNVVELITGVITRNSLVMSFVVVGVLVLAGNWLAGLIRNRRMGFAIAIVLGLALALWSGSVTDKARGIADFPMWAGFGVLGGAMIRDYAIIATAFGAKIEELKKAGFVGVLSLFIGVFFSFFIGATIAYAFGYRTAIDLTTIGAGAVTFIVGPVTGTAIGASSAVIALSIAVGVVKAVLCMSLTPLMARYMKLDNPQTAMVFGGILGTTSGVAGGLAGVDPKLVPYGAMTATFYTGLGCLLAPSVIFMVMRAIFP